MSRWIDGEWLLNFFEPYPDDYQTPLGALRACVDDAPSLDIVRCVECKRANYELSGVYCGLSDVNMGEDGFCSIGERRTDD